ncbi:hypothetical protein FQN54_006784 [Arachnomyces sp. PD_36]|nr:hypothetical protein FQN54_006784 [Arachnomyces sp. PD_36]
MFLAADFVGQEITFPGPGSNSSTWLLTEQISENLRSRPKEWCDEYGFKSEVRGVFYCSKVAGEGPDEAVIKIIMQTPWKGSEVQSSEKRALQKLKTDHIDEEAEALVIFRRVNCSSAPQLIASKVVEQSKNMCVPGGFLGFIAKTRLPGVTIPWMNRLTEEEGEAMRRSFRESWM